MSPTHPHRRPADDPTIEQPRNTATKRTVDRTDSQSATIEAYR